ncbi:hypothetical protein [Asanoa ferruginea]|uniref:hypothetical protein n=1 Tax=Asanoa ferruginea TaxID=53367 RepID=UPI001EF35099|nr:hypothetical protein [Asanoa ferruginea]
MDKLEQDVRTLLAAGDDPGAALDALPLLRTIRDRIDATESALIESARLGGASWATIAGALGLATRQAAEQRYLRLTGDQSRDVRPTRQTRQRQRSVDTQHGPAIAHLRATARTLLRRIEADAAWPDRFPRATLAHDTLKLAADAPPGALFSLATSVIDDLGPAHLPEPIQKAADDLRTALS